MEEETVPVVTPTDTVPETEETPPPETEDKPEVDVAQLQATNKKLFERAKKAEAELKVAKTSKPAEATPAPSQNIEETVLLAQGMPEELLTQLKKVAQVQGISLIKAQADPIFVAVKEKLEKEQKQKEASLPASRGSGGVKAQKDFSTPNLSEEEHRKMFNERVNG